MTLIDAARGKSIVSARGQTVIPKEVREALGITEGTRLSWTVKGKHVYLVPIPDDPVRALRGILKGHGTFDEWMEQRNEERRQELAADEEERKWRASS
jgi:AbrB family looped-hinge helix DNA binding protein